MGDDQLISVDAKWYLVWRWNADEVEVNGREEVEGLEGDTTNVAGTDRIVAVKDSERLRSPGIRTL